MTSTLSFDVYGFKFQINSGDFDLNLLNIKKEFQFFAVDRLNNPADLDVKLMKFTDRSHAGIHLFKTRMCSVYQLSFSKREYFYRTEDGNKAYLTDQFDSGKRIGILNTDSLELASDILYFYLNSTVGEYLDSIGLMRIHAFSYSINEETGLIYGRPGTGKSTIALKYLESSDAHIYSDEITLLNLKDKCLYPFPLRMATHDPVLDNLDQKFNYFFKTKYLLEIPPERIAKKSELKSIRLLSAKEIPLSKTGFLIEIIAGTGLIQMTEFLLRFNNWLTLFKILINRLRLALFLSTYPITNFEKDRQR